MAERTIAAHSILSSDPDAIHPVTREIILSGLRPTAIDAFAAFYKLETLRRVADQAFSQIDALVLPTAPTPYSSNRFWPIRSSSTVDSAHTQISSICSIFADWRCPLR